MSRLSARNTFLLLSIKLSAAAQKRSRENRYAACNTEFMRGLRFPREKLKAKRSRGFAKDTLGIRLSSECDQFGCLSYIPIDRKPGGQNARNNFVNAHLLSCRSDLLGCISSSFSSLLLSQSFANARDVIFQPGENPRLFRFSHPMFGSKDNEPRKVIFRR